MRMDSSSRPKLVAVNDSLEGNGLDDLLNTLVVMRWDLNDALYDTADAPPVIADRVKQLRRELDVSIVALKAVIEKRGLPRQSLSLDG
jgi:hypothetical protein